MKFIPIIFICIVIYFLYRHIKRNKQRIEIQYSQIVKNAPVTDKDVSYSINSQKCTITFKSRIWDWDENAQCPVHDPALDIAVAKNLTRTERLFFDTLKEASTISGLHGVYEIARNSAGIFSVNYSDKTSGLYVGKIFFTDPYSEYAVVKSGATRASRVFKSHQEAVLYIDNHNKGNYIIEERKHAACRYMQVLSMKAHAKSLDDIICVEIINKPLSVYLSALNGWIKYIKDLKIWDEHHL